MKKILLSVVLVMGVFMFANAQSEEPQTKVIAETVAVVGLDEDGFTEVKLEALPQNAQTAIKKYSETNTVKSILHNAEKKLIKVTLISKENKAEKVVTLNEDGKEV